MAVCAYQGEPGSYSEEALWRHMGGKGIRGLPCPSFREAVAAVAEGRATMAMLPVQNTLVGPIVNAVAAIENAGLDEVDQFSLAIQHCLIGHLDGTAHAIRRVYSHPAALDQCRNFLAGQGYQALPAADTAGAVREVKERGDMEEAAVASRRAAALHHMKVLATGIQDEGINRTRFAVLRRAP